MNFQIIKPHRLVTICLFFAIISVVNTHAQTINPQYISIADGLSSTQVKAVFQDEFGLLWIGTTNGLQQYDGNTFKNFRSKPGDLNSLINNDVWDLTEDDQNNIWVATGSGISKYDRNNNSFTNYANVVDSNETEIQTGLVFNVFFDSQKRLWATSQFAGLIRYDPALDSWSRAMFQISDSSESSSSFLIGLAEDDLGNIWSGSREYGLYFLPPGDSLFRKAPISPSTNINFSEDFNHITSMYSDSTNTLWLTTRNGVYKYYPETGVVNTIKEYDYNSETIANNYNSIKPDRDGNIWISNNFRGVLKFNGLSDEYQEVDISGVAQLRGGGISSIFTDFIIDNSGIFWFGTLNEGLMKYDPISNPFRYYPIDETSMSGLSGGAFSLLVSKVRPNTVFIGTRGGWLNILNRETESIERYTYLHVNDMFGGSIRSIAENDDGSLWLGTWGDGLIETNSQYQEINRYTNDPQSFTGLSGNAVRVLKKHPNGDLWIGTDFGLNVLDADTKLIKRIQSVFTRTYPEQLYEFVNNQFTSDQAIASIVQVSDNADISQSANIETTGEYLVVATGEGDDNGMYDFGWLENDEGDIIWSAENMDDTFHAGGGIKNRGLIDFISLDKGTVHLRYKSDDSHSYDSWNVDAPSFINLWGITLIKIEDQNSQNDIHEYLQQPNNDIYINGSSIRDIHIDIRDNNILWVSDFGLTRIDLSDNSVQSFNHNPENPNSISSNLIFGIYQEPDRSLWLTTDQGLNHFDPETESVIAYTEEDGLPTNFTESVLPGENNGLWISTQNGLSQMISSESIGKVTFINYNASDGIGGENFIGLIAGKTDDGTFYFGGEHGLTEFSNIQANLTPPRMFISDLKISNESVLEMKENSPLTQSLFRTDHLDLTYNQNDLSFDFSALHFGNPQKNQYAHMLEGFDEDWIYDNRNFASYTNLEPGNYTFRIRGSNSDGIWNEEGKSVSISIASPWWRTLWAYSFYLMLLIGGFVLVDKVQRKRLLRKQIDRARVKELKHAKEIELAYENLKAAQEQLVQQEKLASLGQLTAGIAHEIKNPLNFVNNFSELSVELVEEAREEVNEKLSADSHQLTAILDDIEANLHKIHEHGSRADSIVKSMLEHSRGGSGKKEPTDLNGLVMEYVNLSFHGMRAGKNPINVDMEFELDEAIGEVPLVAEDFSRVIVNLCNNGFDAMREKLSAISDQPSASYHPKITVRTKSNGNNVTIEIEDNGPGIQDDIKDKILQPFFTTKKGTAGTGLGLSITNDIIKA
ncbi:MAG: two-component regulator propeller domain-containing protein, partial [Cyclobacteriaceae bacterium]